MADDRRSLTSLLVLPALILTTLAPALADRASRLPEAGIAQDERALHLLNRLGYGPRPGDVERVEALGLESWIEAQLAAGPAGRSVADERLETFDTLTMTPVELFVAYPPPQLINGLNRVLTTRMGMDESLVAGMFPELERIERRQAAQQNGDDPREMEKEPGGDRRREMMNGPMRIVVELAQAKLIRATYSENQLHEVMNDFWFNHFNVFIGKSTDRWWVTSYEHDAIRPHALGNFRDLLGAVARHPAMLIYLDNWLSSAPGVEFDRRDAELLAARANRGQGLPAGGVATLLLRGRGIDTARLERQIDRRNAAMRSERGRRGRAGEDRPGPQRNGLNENYARELLELHTLGVDGGYTQDDIIEVARCFTGWTLLPLHAGQGFAFVPELHDSGTKTVLGRKIKGKGMAEGEQVLDLLAGHPQTARFVSSKLARRFVSDDPPASLVEKMATTFLESDGDIASVLRTMFYSEEFWAPEALHAKIKTPFEYVVSLLRATDAEILPLPARPGLVGALRELGQPLYGAQPPTGYDDTAESWISTGALLNRLKLAIAFASDKIPGVEIPPSAATVASVERQLGLSRSPEVRRRLALAWLLAAPEFQRR